MNALLFGTQNESFNKLHFLQLMFLLFIGNKDLEVPFLNIRIFKI